VTSHQIAEAIMDDIRKRKGLGKIWIDYWGAIDDRTRVAIIDAWAKLIESGDEK
jgi:hypothetical protein